LESYAPGGQAGASSLIENFFGFRTGITGGELTYSAQLQAYRFGAKFSTPSQALTLAFTDGEHRASLQAEGCNAILRAKCVKRCAAAVGEGGTAVEGVHEVLRTYA